MNDPVTSAAAEIRYREIFESALVGIYASRPDGTLVWCNAAFARILGFDSVAEAMSTNMATVHATPERRAQWLDMMRERSSVDQIVVRLRRRDGEFVRVLTAVVGEFDQAGALVELRGFIMDVTASAEQEDALKERELQFRSVFLGAADAMLILDDRRGVVDANRAAAALFGAPIEALIGRRLDDLLVNEQGQLEHAWRELLALGEAKRDHRVLSPTHDIRIVECSYRAAVQAGRHLCIARDITDRQLLEERLMQSEKVESVGRLAGGIAHDFNNLLTAILGYTELLLGTRGPEDPDRADLEEIQKAGQRAAALTQQLLAYSRKQMLSPKEVDLNQTVVGLQSMLTRLIREDITLSYELAPEPALVRIDPTQLEQVILNLVLNSRDALMTGGFIRLEVARVKLADVDLPSDHPTRTEQYVRLRVVDNGVGIAPEAWPHLFEPFFTTKDIGKGTGLGLASVYGIVRQSNGFVAVESEPNLGTTFTMHFPAVAARAAGEAGAAESAPASSAGGPGGSGGPDASETILLVEDEDAVRVIVSAVLRRQGYQVLEAATPHGAIEIFGRHGATIDLLLTDVVMPEMNGPSLAQRLVAERPELRILFISGYADVASPLDAGGPNVSFLSKPFQASALAAKVREALGRRR
jgi:two-component system, cell cycle sensor histidine kinase and response regulator CckA